MVELMAWLLSAGSFLVTLYLIRTRGFLQGFRPVWLVVLLLLPTWFVALGTVRIDARSACALAILVGFLMQPVHKLTSHHLYFSDLLVLLLIIAMTLSQFAVHSIAPLAPLDPFREIALPYIAGRLFVRSRRDIESILPTICWVSSILAGLACFEAFSHLNPIEAVLGKPSDLILDPQEGVRWGLLRATGPQTHPIYLGLTFAMLMPWAIEAAVESWQGRGPLWWRAVPLLVLAGVIATVSRSAQIAVLIVFGAIFFQVFPRHRPALTFVVLALGIAFFAYRDEVILMLSQYAQESKPGDEYVQINGIFHEYSGTKHRDLLDLVYEEAAEKAGWLGYGTMMATLPRDPNMDKRFISIDNHYLMFYLQYGYLGLGLFVCLAASCIWNLLPAALGAPDRLGRLAAGLVGALCGGLIAMRGVWFAPDYSWVWLFCAGLSASVSLMYREYQFHGAMRHG